MSQPAASLDESDMVGAIAREVGVSTSTVRRCLSGAEARYGATARRMETIRQVADRLGYVPNQAARALRRGRFDAVALLSSSVPIRSFLPERLIAGLADGLSAHDVRMTMAHATDDVLGDPARLQRLLQRLGADGLVLDYIDHVPPGIPVSLAALHLPAVWVNRDVPCDGVRVDDQGGARAVTLALWRMGCRRIAYVDFAHDREAAESHYSAGERRRGWMAALAATGAAGDCFNAFVPTASRTDVARRWLRSLPHLPDAIVGYHAEHAAITMLAAHLEGLPAPSQRCLGAVDVNPCILGSPYVCAQLPLGAVAEETVRMLLAKVDAPGVALPTVIVPLDVSPPPV